MNKNGFSNTANVFCEKTEKNIEKQYTLAEYCPSIQRVVCNRSHVGITEHHMSVDGLCVTGKINNSVMYVSDYQNKLKSVNFSDDFSVVLPLSKEIPNDDTANICLKAELDSNQIKMLSSREISIKSKLVVTAEIQTFSENKNFEVEDECVFALEETVEMSTKNINSRYNQKFDGEINIQPPLMPVSEILYSNADIVIENTECYENGVKANGYVSYQCMYAPNTETENQMEENVFVREKLPFEFECDVQGIDKSARVVMQINVTNVETQCSYDSYGENRVLGVNCTYDVNMRTYSDCKGNVCTDAFCSDYESSVSKKSKRFDRLVDVINEDISVSQNVRLDMKSFVEIIDCSYGIKTLSQEKTENKYFVLSKGNLNVLGRGENGDYNYMSMPLALHIPVNKSLNPEDDLKIDAYCNVTSVQVEVKNGEAVCKVGVNLDGTITDSFKIDIVEELKRDTTKKRERQDNQVVIYYPGKNDSVWDIAKKYGCSPEEIRKANNLESDDASGKKMLVIR